MSEYLDLDLMKRLYCGVEALRNSFSQILKWLPIVVAGIVLKPIDECMPADILEETWQALEVDPELTSRLLRLRLCVVSGRLDASLDIVGEQGFADEATYCIARLWRFTKFSEGRWASIGSATKRLACGLLSGIDQVVQRIRSDPGESNWHINGWVNLCADGRSFVVVAASSSRVSYVILRQLLTDSRLAARVQVLQQEAMAAMDRLSAVRGRVWEPLAAVSQSGRSGIELRSQAIHAAHVGYGFTCMRMFDHVSKEPWCIATGDTEGNLQRLKTFPCPAETVAANIWHLLRIGWPFAGLVAGFRLLLQCRWSTDATEQQHVSLALMHRFHPDAGQESLLVRAGIHSLRHLLPEASKLERAEAKLCARLEKLHSRQPQKHQGRQQYFKGLTDLAVYKRRCSGARVRASRRW